MDENRNKQHAEMLRHLREILTDAREFAPLPLSAGEGGAIVDADGHFVDELNDERLDVVYAMIVGAVNALPALLDAEWTRGIHAAQLRAAVAERDAMLRAILTLGETRETMQAKLRQWRASLGSVCATSGARLLLQAADMCGLAKEMES